MKSSVSSFDISALLPELRDALIGAFVDKIYQPKRDELLFVFNTKEGRKELLMKSGRYLFMGRKGDNPQEPSSLVMFLRKNLGNAKVTDIMQHGFDRIVEMELEKRERYTIIAEFFRNGNISIVKDGIIMVPLFFQRWSTRALIPKEEYRYPPESADPRSMEKDEMIAKIRESDRDIVRTLATRLNLGGTYAEEVCLIAGVEKKKKAKDIKDEMNRIIEAIDALFKRLENPEPVVYYEESEPVDVSPFPLKVYEGYENKQFESMNDALYAYFTEIPEEERVPQNPAAERIERQIAQQEQAIEEFRKKMEDSRRKAELIYAHYNEIEILLSKIREMDSSELSSLRKLPYFVSMDLERKRITIKIDNEDVTLDFTGVNESAQRYYKEAKRMKEKIKGAEEALEKSRKKLETAMKEIKEEPKKERRKKRHWFERYRWFISSDENLVIAGRDAKTNERVVKKHMKDEDIYAHAEIHGAPSVIVKRNGDEPIGEQTLKEACEFALCFSKAWPSKIGGGAAYWVKPSQVSKTPQAGEFLARGAFVIRGKRNYVKAELKLAVGFVNYRDEKLLTCAPISAMHRWCDEYWVIVPGDERKEIIAKKLSKEMGADVDELVSSLPSGGSTIVEKRKGDGNRVERRF